MKKLLYLLPALAGVLILLQCTEEKDGVDDFTEKTEFTGDYSYSEMGRGGNSGNGDTLAEPIEPGQITAGEWNDLLSWDFWNNLGQHEAFNEASERWKFDFGSRYSFVVRDSRNDPVIDCKIALKNIQGESLWVARTDNEGKAELWLIVNEGQEDNPVACIEYNDEELTIVNPLLFENGTNEVVLNTNAQARENVDISFVVDATGSMTDEIAYLKAELLDVLKTSMQINSSLELRTSAVFYRDEGDDYLTRVSPFTPITESTIAFIGNQEADGGGDYEEAVHTALNTAIDQLSWNSTARARLLFLVLDAPPHYESSIVRDINNAIQNAASKGIKIIPVSASGVNKDTEFLFRFFSVATSGTYVFITNDSGIGLEHIEATVGDYEVEMLNELIVRLITKYTR